jgi:type IV pilus assembly protein PilC
MSYFKYSGFAPDGSDIVDTIEAASRDEALRRLEGQGVFVARIGESRRSTGASGSGRIKAMDVVVFTRLLSTMVNANIPIIEGLEISSDQLPAGQFQQVVRRLIADIRRGLSLSEALEAHPQIFNRLYVSMVRAGELSGKLGRILEQLFTYMERMQLLRRKVISALIYPSIVMVAAMLIIGLFLVVFIPQFKENFNQFGDKLPSMTRFFIGLSDVFRAYGLYAAGGIVLAVLGLLRYAKTRAGRFFFDRLRLKLPLAGRLFSKVILVRVTRTLGTLLGNGVPILDAMQIVSGASGNAVMEDLLLATGRRISDGERMAKTLSTSPLIPRMVLQMVAMGEETGNLPEMLEKSAQFYDSDVDIAVEQITSAIAPVLIIGVGLFVGLIVIALFMPIFNMSQFAG